MNDRLGSVSYTHLGAYLPIDPGYPHDRIAYMIADAGVRIVLTQSALRDVVDGLTSVVIVLDDERETADSDGWNLEPAAEAGSAAYVIYTSGSTGRPKGVLIEHRSVCLLYTSYTSNLETVQKFINAIKLPYQIVSGCG